MTRNRIGPATSGPVGYRQGEAHPCPSCGQSQWHVGRQTAECAHCATALPLTGPQRWLPPASNRPRRVA